MMEIPIETPNDRDLRKSLMFDLKYQNAENLIKQVAPNILQFDQLNSISEAIQNNIKSSDVIEDYALDLWEATQHPEKFGIQLDQAEVSKLINHGASPRGMGMLLKAARVNAWLMNRSDLYPEDLHAVFHAVIAHRLVFNTMYESRRTLLSRELTTQILKTLAIPHKKI